MRTAIDTNVLSALLSAEPGYSALAEQLDRASREGTLVLSAPAYAELLAYPLASVAQIDTFLSDASIMVDYLADANIWLLAGTAFRRYAQRRRKSKGGEAKRFLIDFIIGAHACLHADRLFTLDRTRYSRDFPKLRLN